MSTNSQNHTLDGLGIEKIRAEITNLIDDSLKKRTEARWHPLVVGAGLFSAGGVFVGAIVGSILALLKYLQN